MRLYKNAACALLLTLPLISCAQNKAYDRNGSYVGLLTPTSNHHRCLDASVEMFVSGKYVQGEVRRNIPDITTIRADVYFTGTINSDNSLNFHIDPKSRIKGEAIAHFKGENVYGRWTDEYGCKGKLKLTPE